MAASDGRTRSPRSSTRFIFFQLRNYGTKRYFWPEFCCCCCCSSTGWRMGFCAGRGSRMGWRNFSFHAYIDSILYWKADYQSHLNGFYQFETNEKEICTGIHFCRANKGWASKMFWFHLFSFSFCKSTSTGIDNSWFGHITVTGWGRQKG